MAPVRDHLVATLALIGPRACKRRLVLAVAVTVDSLQRVDLGLDLIDRAGERVFRSAHTFDGPFGGRQHRAGRVFLGILRHSERLPEPEAAEILITVYA